MTMQVTFSPIGAALPMARRPMEPRSSRVAPVAMRPTPSAGVQAPSDPRPLPEARGFEGNGRRGGRYALAISAALHVAVLLAAGSVMPTRNSGTEPRRREPVMVLVHLPPLVPGAGAEPKVAPVGATPATIERASLESRPIAPSRPAEPDLQSTGHSEDASQAPAAIAESIAGAAGPSPVPAPEKGLGNESTHAAGGGVEVAPAQYLHTPEPRYPESAREDGEEGLVVLRVRISTEGRPEEIRIDRSSGFRALDSAAVAGLKRWTFVPARRGLRALESWMDIPIRFRLR